MANKETKLSIIVDAKNKAEKALGSVSDNLASINKNNENLLKLSKKMATVGAIGFGAIATGVGLATKAFAESQAQLTIADEVLEKLGDDTLRQFSGGLDQAKQIAREFGDEMQALGGVSGEEVTIAFSKFLQITKDSSQAMEAASLAADLATFKQIDYGTAADVVTKVLSGQTGILERYGIAVDEGATATEALAAISNVAGGQYEAFGKTISGQTLILKQSFGDLQEEVGAVFVPVLNSILTSLQPIVQNIIEWVKQNPELTKTIIIVTAAIAGVVTILGVLGMVLPVVAAGIAVLSLPILLIIGVIGLLAYTLIKFHDQWDLVWSGIKIIMAEVVNMIIGLFETMINFIISGINGIIKSINKLIDKLKSIPKIGKAFKGIDNISELGAVSLNKIDTQQFVSPSRVGSVQNIVVTGNTLLDENAGEQLGDQIIKKLQLSSAI